MDASVLLAYAEHYAGLKEPSWFRYKLCNLRLNDVTVRLSDGALLARFTWGEKYSAMSGFLLQLKPFEKESRLFRSHTDTRYIRKHLLIIL